MDEYTLAELARLKADRLRLSQAQPSHIAAHSGGTAGVTGETVMRTLIAIAGSLILNFAALGALQWNVRSAQAAPAGTVFVQQLPDDSTLTDVRVAGDVPGNSVLCRNVGDM